MTENVNVLELINSLSTVLTVITAVFFLISFVLDKIKIEHTGWFKRKVMAYIYLIITFNNQILTSVINGEYYQIWISIFVFLILIFVSITDLNRVKK